MRRWILLAWLACPVAAMAQGPPAPTPQPPDVPPPAVVETVDVVAVTPLHGSGLPRLHIPANIPVKNFWSVVAYDADSRSILRSSQPFPSVSSYTGPAANADGSIDIEFGPGAAEAGRNSIETVPGKGWFVLFRFYGPLEPFFDKTWKPDDIVEIK